MVAFWRWIRSLLHPPTVARVSRRAARGLAGISGGVITAGATLFAAHTTAGATERAAVVQVEHQPEMTLEVERAKKASELRQRQVTPLVDKADERLLQYIDLESLARDGDSSALERSLRQPGGLARALNVSLYHTVPHAGFRMAADKYLRADNKYRAQIQELLARADYAGIADVAGSAQAEIAECILVLKFEAETYIIHGYQQWDVHVTVSEDGQVLISSDGPKPT